MMSGASTGTLSPSSSDPLQAENDYFRTWQLQRPATMTTSSGLPHRTAPMPPTSHSVISGVGGSVAVRQLPGSLRFAGEGLMPSAGARGRSVPEHVYESPKLDRRDFVGSPTSPNNECGCCCERTNGNIGSCGSNGGGGGAVCGLQDSEMCSCGQTHQQYFELDNSGRPARV
jgi:hypothetical protein